LTATAPGQGSLVGEADDNDGNNHDDGNDENNDDDGNDNFIDCDSSWRGELGT